MKERIIRLLIFLVAVALGAALVLYSDWRSRNLVRPDKPVVVIDSVKTDIDTTTAVAPVPAEVRPRDTIYIRVPVYVGSSTPNVVSSPDTNVVSSPDSVEVALPIEQKVYEDSTYRAVVSGFRPSLDSISVYNRTVTVYQTATVYVEPSRWSVGIQAGFGASSAGLTPYVGVGIQYRIWSPRRR